MTAMKSLAIGIMGVAGLSLALALFSFANAAEPHAKRQKVIDFDDEVVEGMNKRPWDSLTDIADRDGRRHRPHLYRKRAGFSTENRETLHTLRYVP